MKSAHLLLLLLVVLVTAAGEAAASLETKVNVWVVSGQTINVEDQSFTIYLSSKTNEILADYGKGSLFIMNNSCDSTQVARLCVDGIQYDIASRIYKVKVRGISLAPSITVTREAAKTEFRVGEEVTFSVTLSNTGGLASNVTFEEDLPEELEVSSVDGMQFFRAGAVRWSGKLATDESVSFSYKIKALDVFDGSLVSSVAYSDGLRLRTAYSSRIALKVSSPLVLDTRLGKGALIVGERGNMTINLTNYLPETAVINAEITFDPGLRVVSQPYGVKSASQYSYTWSGEMEKSNRTVNSSKAFFFEFRGTRLGSSGISAKVSYRPKSQAEFRKLPVSKKNVVVSDRGVIVRTSLKDATFEANQGKWIKVWLQNQNPYAGLVNVYVNMSTGLVYLPNAYFGSMGPQEQAILVDKFFYAPAVDKSTGYVLETNVSYLTEFGDNLTKTFRDTATVSLPQEIVLSQTVSAKRAKPGDEVAVTVSIRNLRLTRLKNIQLSDNVSHELEILGKNFATIEAGSKETVAAYSYRLKMPHVRKETVFYVNTTMAYSDKYNYDPYFDPKGYTYAKATPITVEPEGPSLSLARTVSDSSVYVGEPFTVKYVITNTATDQIAKNIVLKLPLMPDLDSIEGDFEVRISQLRPGESIAVANSEKHRAKLPGSLEIKKATVEYQNSYGDVYLLNGTATKITVKENYLNGPIILLEKIVPKSANNTAAFRQQLKVKNIGTNPAAVMLEDEGAAYSITVPNGTEYFINRTGKYATPGMILLPHATAAYSYNGETLRTASSPVSIEIIDTPVLSISKSVSQNITNLEPFTVLLGIKNSVGRPVQNISVKDGDKDWAIPSIAGEGSANLTYESTITAAGQQSLGQASLTYSYEGAIYSAKSNSMVIDIKEKMLVSIFKMVKPGAASPGEKVRITIRAKSSHNEPLELSVSGNGKKFSATLPAGEEKSFSYDMPANASVSEPAVAAYFFKGQSMETVSGPVNFTLLESSLGTNQTADSSSGSGSERIFSKIIKRLQGILSWKRG